MVESLDPGSLDVPVLDDDLASRQIKLPYNFKPRAYQEAFFDAVVSRDVKRSLCIWHRRAGKDKTHFNALVCKAMQRVGNYGYVFPTYNQGRKALWNAIDGDGFRIIDHDAPVRRSRNNTEMVDTFANGSTWQILGSDEDLDKLRGMNLVGVVLSEYSYELPQAWERVFRPMLLENKGWMWANFTPNGRNHGYFIAEMAKKSDDWFYEVLTVDDTRRDDGSAVISLGDIDQERAEGVEEEVIQQEYYCSFDTTIKGAYYADQLRVAWADKRIGRIPIDPALDVRTFWDIGIGDKTAIWFVQSVGPEIRLVDYHEDEGQALPHYLNLVKDWAKKYDCRFGHHYAPWDFASRQFTTGETPKQAAADMGFHFAIAAKLNVNLGIDMVRRLFPRFWIDDVRCQQGLTAITEYKKEWDEKRQTYLNKPRHDWASHGADALRTLGLVWNELFGTPLPQRSIPVMIDRRPILG